jgi:hypothetical protein
MGHEQGARSPRRPANGDLGYATTLEYEHGRLFTIYCCQDAGTPCVQGTHVDLLDK